MEMQMMAIVMGRTCKVALKREKRIYMSSGKGRGQDMSLTAKGLKQQEIKIQCKALCGMMSHHVARRNKR